MVRRIRPVELRYYLISGHYRSGLDYSEEAMADAGAAYRRAEGYVLRASDVAVGVDPASAALPDAFTAAMDDDLRVPEALAVVFDHVRDGNTLLQGGDSAALRQNLAAVRRMLGLLGLDPLSEPWARRDGGALGTERLGGVLDSLVTSLLKQRDEARGRRDFETADAIRTQLTAAGIVVEDTPAGPRWELAFRDHPGDPADGRTSHL